jgi:NAD(P)-dependent dehydrogenase (short-subunit alcohol dehydrogenase family)
MSDQSPERVPPIDDWNRLLDGRVAVVTGGGDGIGGAISRLFAAHGAIVEIAEVDPGRAEQVVAEIIEGGGRARAHVVDVRRPEDVARLRGAVLADHPAPDVLVNNVGDYRPIVRFHDSTPESWNEMYEVNFLHAVQVTHTFLGPMIDNGGASIVNLHSVEGMRGYPGEPIYGAMKAALAHFTTCLAAGYGRKGIRVNGIGPDVTQTPQVDYLAGYEDVDELWESWVPVGRLGWPDDPARVALFLASDMSSFVTGHNIPVDGGTKAGGGWFFSPTAGRFVNRPKTL